MAKPEWGMKRTCQMCGKKYYDLNKSLIICPSCGAEFDPNFFLKTRKGKSISSKSSLENNIELTEDIENIENIDDIEVVPDDEVVSNDDPLPKILEEEDNVNHIKNRIPFKRFGLPEEVVEAIIFLASKNSSYITGSTICVDGGYSIG